MFVYLSFGGGRVELPAVTDVEVDWDDEYVRFLDRDGQTVAVFRRADTAIYTEKDFGPVLVSDALDDPTREA